MKPINESEFHIQQKLSTNSSMVQRYKDAQLQAEALKLIPVEEFNIKATQKLSLVEDGDDINLEDLILIELLHWFKNSFFSWVDTPECEVCGHQTTSVANNLTPTESEAQWNASVVEGYFCSICRQEVRFPRYNHPGKLLETRRGRCGEWANCFTLLCYAMQYEARLVVDFGDHVWTEVFLTDRWVHCDPCEDSFDRPLMYELGWGKKIGYIIGFSVLEVQDVTWRYTTHFDDVCKRRDRCREEFLEELVWSLTEKLQEKLPKKEQDERRDRRFEELMCFLTPSTDDATYEGRTSGSLAWRLDRAETKIPSEGSGYVFKLCPEEIQERHFLIKYSCAKDKYVRSFGDRCIETEGWKSWVFEERSVFRKLEKDWKMVYLARKENSEFGSVTWRFDLAESGLVVDRLRLSLHSETFDKGNIECQLYPNCEMNRAVTFGKSELTPLVTEALRDCSSFLLTVELSEGSGTVAWQHSQLFRQPLDSQTFPLELELFFKAPNKCQADEN